MRTLPMALLVPLVLGSATAQSPTYNRCLAHAGHSSNAIAACSQQELRRQDKRVDRDYRTLQVRSQRHPEKQADVRTDQRNWLQHRDFICSKPNESESMSCLIRETAAQADKLDARLH